MCLFDVDETPRTVGLSPHFGMITGAYTRFAINASLVNPKFLELMLIMLDNEKRFKPLYTGLRNMINVSRLLSAAIPLPDLVEQSRIIDEVEQINNWTTSVLVAAGKAIELATERRAALISAAVTGKIDVRSKA